MNTNNHPDLAYQTVVDVLSANGIRQEMMSLYNWRVDIIQVK